MSGSAYAGLGADSADALWRETLLQEMAGTLFGPMRAAPRVYGTCISTVASHQR